MSAKHLVLGATGGIGFAFVQKLLSNKIKTTILVRDEKKAKKLFGGNPLLEVVTGNVNDPVLLKEISVDKEVIFLGINTPYQLWEKQMENVVRNVITAARQNKATILFPGNNYAFGNIKVPITEQTVPHPVTRKGRLRRRLVNLLKEAAAKGDCKVIVLRLPLFFGPNVTNGLIKPVFHEAIKNKPIKWIINAGIPHQFVFTPDAAQYFYLLMEERNLPQFFLINYGGYTVKSIKDLAQRISQIQGNPAKVKVIPKALLNVIAWFNPEVRELKEMFYQFENSIILADDQLKKMYPEVNETTLNDALKKTLDWYEHRYES